MTKKTIWGILATISFAVCLLAGLLYFAPPLPNQHNNGFSRILLSNTIHPIVQQQTEIPLETICGATDHHIFFSTPNPSCIIRQNYALNKPDTIFFPVNLTPKVLSTRNFAIDSPWSYLFINNEPGFVFGKLNDSVVQNAAFTSTRQLFIQSMSVSPTTVIIRTFDSLQSKQVFQKIYSPNGQILAEEELFNDQQDMGFGTGGLLRFDKAKNLLVYVLSFQNQFITLDTNLTVLHKFNTIDTTFVNDIQFKQANIEGVDKFVPAKARIIVNKNAFAENGILYVLSRMRADNETIGVFNNNSVIDIYYLKDGTYSGSFYLPNIEGEKVRSFIIRKDKLIALYKKNIAIFSIILPT